MSSQHIPVNRATVDRLPYETYTDATIKLSRSGHYVVIDINFPHDQKTRLCLTYDHAQHLSDALASEISKGGKS